MRVTLRVSSLEINKNEHVDYMYYLADDLIKQVGQADCPHGALIVELSGIQGSLLHSSRLTQDIPDQPYSMFSAHWDSRVRNLVAKVLLNVAWSVALPMARPAPKWMERYLPVQTEEGRAGSGLRIGDLLWASRLWLGGSSLSLWSWACSSARWTGDEMSFLTFMII